MIDISLCIPTMRRWDFLKINIPKYLGNSFISEIVIVDETGEDYAVLKENYGSEPKIKLFKNESQLGPFLNKLECIKKATFDWVCLIDSDNSVDEDYFMSFFSFINNKPISNLIYMPSLAKPRFNFGRFESLIIDRTNTRDFVNKGYQQHTFVTLLNMGNYIIHKSSSGIINKLIACEPEVAEFAKSVLVGDVIYMNYLLLKNDFSLVVVPDMSYEHVCHENNLCARTQGQFEDKLTKIFNNVLDLS